MKVNDRVTVKTDGGPRRPGVVLAVEEFSEGTMYLVALEDYPLASGSLMKQGIRTVSLLRNRVILFSLTGGKSPVRMC